jgi:hypothetical protein
MTRDEDWVAEQVRLMTLEDGFGPGYSARSGGPSTGASASDDAEAATSRAPSA